MQRTSVVIELGDGRLRNDLSMVIQQPQGVNVPPTSIQTWKEDITLFGAGGEPRS